MATRRFAPTVADQVATGISKLGVMFDPRRRAAARQSQATEALTRERTAHEQAQTATENEKTRGLKTRNDSLDSIQGDAQAFFQKHGIDDSYAPLFAQFIKVAQTKNPAQMGDLMRQFVATYQTLSGDPDKMRQALVTLGHNPTNSTAMTAGESEAAFQRGQQGREKIANAHNDTALQAQQMRTEQSGANVQTRVAGSLDQQKLRNEQSGANNAATNATREKIAANKLGVPTAAGGPLGQQRNLDALRGEAYRVLGMDPRTGKTASGKTIPMVWIDAIANRTGDYSQAGETNLNRAAWHAANDILGPGFDIENKPLPPAIPHLRPLPTPGAAPVMPVASAQGPAPTVPASPVSQAPAAASSLGLPMQQPTAPGLQDAMAILSRPAPAASAPSAPSQAPVAVPQDQAGPTVTVRQPIKLDPTNPEHLKIRDHFLTQAHGDKNLARQLARDAGFVP